MEENFENNAEKRQINVDAGSAKVDDMQQVNKVREADQVKEVNDMQQGANTSSSERNNANPHNGHNELNRLSMGNKGYFHADRGGAAVAGNSRMLVVLGWISAALTFLISPLFAIAGVIFGVMVNREAKGQGNAIIITNIVLAVLGMVLGFFTTMMQY